MTELILIGGGGHARACIDVIEMEAKFDIAGIVDSHLTSHDCVSNYPILGSDADLQKLLLKNPYSFIAVGQIISPDIRISLFNKLKSYHAIIPVIKSPLAYLSKSAQVGEGSILMHRAVVNANARIGANCIINSSSLVEHDAEIGAHCHISTGALINGGVLIGEGCFVGSGAIIREGIQIGDRVHIGAGQVVLRNISTGTKVRGSDL